MFDVFYYGNKPNLFPFEQSAINLEVAANKSRTKFFWFVDGQNDYTNFNFNFRALPWEENHIHTWPDQWQQDGGVYFANKDTVSKKIYNYHNERVHRLPNLDYWQIPNNIDPASIDCRWAPDPMDPPTEYHFPSQHQSSSGAVYRCPDANGIKLVDAFVVTAIPTTQHWYVPDNIDPASIDFTWHPNVLDTPTEYYFPSQHQSSSGVIYKCPNAIGIKVIDAFIVQSIAKLDYWYVPDNIDPASIDFTWHPNVLDPPTTYHFPVQWTWDNIGGPEYKMPAAEGDKFINNFVARTKSNLENWVIPDNINKNLFDFSWAPHPLDPPFIYKFPTMWNGEGGPEYHVPTATEMKYINEQVAETIADMTYWTIPEEINKDTVDFSWVPHPKSPPYIYHFGTEHQSSVGLTFNVPGATEIKFAGPIPVKGINTKTLEILDIFFIDFNNSTANVKFKKLSEKYPVTKIRYANSIIDTIKRCTTRSTTSKFWVISSEYDYTDFDFSWHAEPWQSYMTHVFASQHQKWSKTFLINKWEFERHITWAKTLEEFPNLHFVNDQTVCVPSDLYDIYLVDHGNEYPKLTNTKDIKVTRHVDNYLDTFKRIMSTATTEYVWIISSLCEYKKFDFSWHPEPWQKEMIHVFPSGNEARGDTFYIHVESFKQQMVELDLLDWFNVINYCKDQMVMRLPIPTQMYEGDNLLNVIKQHEFKHPYTWFFTQNYHLTVEPCLWGAKDKKIYSYSDGNSYVLVPREAKTAIKTQGYDYPYISKSASTYFDERELDIIYISNGEPDEDRWYDHLVKTSGMNVKWVHNIDGRAEAYKAAATRSKTPWFFTVFAKLEVEPDFDWLWQPDYLQEPKHYVFHSHNPVNGLEYGHMGVIAYNKRLVLETDDWGLDFTLSKEHAVVPILSATAYYNTTPELTWRTAFREVLKLKDDVVKTGSIESNHRLKIWLTKAEGNNAEWSLLGATDAIEYYTDVNGNYQKLLLSFEWKWLQEYYATKYNMI